MIISHQHRFIFVRTRKVASSSLEMCLSKILRESDFATHQSDRDHLLGIEYPKLDTRIFRGFDKLGRPLLMNGHSPLNAAYRLFGNRIRDYLVVSAERNPWDRAVSLFYWSNRKNDMKSRPKDLQIAAFRDYAAKNGPESRARRWLGWEKHRAFSQKALYSLGKTSIVDLMLRFEHLNEDLATLSEMLKLPTPLSLEGFNAKTGHRANVSRQYQFYYDKPTRELVADICKWEIGNFGYDFEGKNTPVYQPDPARTNAKTTYLAKMAKN